MRFLKEKGVPLERTFAVASVGDAQHRRSKSVDGLDQRATKKDYLFRGISEDRVIEFEYPEQDGKVMKNIQHAIISPRFLFSYAADYERDNLNKRVGDFYNDKIITF